LDKVLDKGHDPPNRGNRNNPEKIELYSALLTHLSFNVRRRAYELLITFTTPIRSSTLQLISKHFKYLYGDADPGNRGEISSITKHMVHQLKVGSTFHAKALLKLDTSGQQREEHKVEFEGHAVFLDGFVGFIERELGPNCCFPRQISALRALQVLAESGVDPSVPTNIAPKSSHDLPRWPLKRSLRYPRLKSALWRLLLNPFEEIRNSTTLVLKLIHGNAITSDDQGFRILASNVSSALSVEGLRNESNPEEEISRLIGHANSLAALTNRADHADGVGRLLGLQYQFTSSRSRLVRGISEALNEVLGVSESKVSLQRTEISLHGYLLGLKYVIDDSGSLKSCENGSAYVDADLNLHRLLGLCNSIWHSVRNDLCVDSPELSRGADTTGLLEGPKDLLSYSWRALRDTSLLMQAILLHVASLETGSVADNGRLEILRTIYTLCFQQLTALRHRGAFSTVAQTFSLCCDQFACVDSAGGEFENWYQVRGLAD
jgi:Putative death-receptor fusion protein (DUF2428)